MYIVYSEISKSGIYLENKHTKYWKNIITFHLAVICLAFIYLYIFFGVCILFVAMFRR